VSAVLGGGAAGMTRAERERLFTNERAQPLQRLSWWAAAEAALADPGVLQTVVFAPRQSGKSQFLAKEAVWKLFATPGCYVLYIAAAESQSQAVFARKLRRPLERLLKELGVGKRAAIVTKRSIELLEYGSKLEVVATSEDTTPGRSVDLLILDEGRDISDEVYSTLLPSVIAAEGKVLAASTAGRPRGWVHHIVTSPDDSTRVIEAVNENPFAKVDTMDRITRVLMRIFPAFAEREMGNRFAEDDARLLFSPAVLENIVDRDLGELPSSDLEASSFLDLSWRKDITTLATVVRVAPRRPESRDHLVVAALQTWTPAGGEIDFDAVRAALAALPLRFKLRKVLIDEGSQAGAIVPWARTQPGLALVVDTFKPTVTENMRMWEALVIRVRSATLSIPPHQRLLAELGALRVEAIQSGTAWRVADASRRLHRDVSLAVAGACYAAGEPTVEAVGGTLESFARAAATDEEHAAVFEERGGFHGRLPARFVHARMARETASDPDDAPRGRLGVRLFH
jgi:hypothetical protein